VHQLKFELIDHDKRIAMTGYSPLDQHEILIWPNVNNFKITGCLAMISVMTRHFFAPDNFGRPCTVANRSRNSIAFSPVRFAAQMEAVPFGDTSKPTPFGRTDNIDLLANLEQIQGNGLADFVIRGAVNCHFANNSVLSATFLVMPFQRFVDPGGLLRSKSKLDSVIAIRIFRFDLRHNAGAEFNDRHRNVLAFRCKQAGHTQFFSYQSFAHGDYRFSVLEFNFNIDTR
jgi:hypothetical protein